MPNIATGAATGAAAGSVIPGVGTAIGAIGGAAISAIGNFFGNKSNQKASDRLFEKQAQFSREERIAQQKWIEEMYARNNAYNTPAAQMERYKAAGLNPDLIYSQGDSGNASFPEAPSQAATPTASVIPKNTYGDTAAIVAQTGLMTAQAKALESQAKKTDTEESLLTADYLLRKARTESDIELQNSTIYVNHELGQLNHAEAELAAKKLQEIDVAMSQMKEQTNLFKAQVSKENESVVQMRFDRYLKSKEFDLLVKKTYQDIKESNSRIDLNLGQLKDIMATQLARIANLGADTYMKNKQGLLTKEQTLTELYRQTGIDISNQHAKFNFDQAKDWDSTERFTNVATRWIDSVSYAFGQITGGVGSMSKAGILDKPRNRVGF
jgi:hypothetical protein